MEETKKKCEKICDLAEQFVCALEAQANRGLDALDTDEAGKVTDMIKDLCEAEEKLWKACYYKKIVEAMHEEGEKEELMAKLGIGRDDDEMGRAGYDHWRYSSGRFAPSGHGHHTAGYVPTVDPMMHQGIEHMEHNLQRDMRNMHGYQPYMDGHSESSRTDSHMDHSASAGATHMGSERGRRYDHYSKARMGYHESKDSHSKDRMDGAAREYVADMAESVKEIWNDADPTLRKEIKNKFIALTNDLN